MSTQAGSAWGRGAAAAAGACRSVSRHLSTSGSLTALHSAHPFRSVALTSRRSSGVSLFRLKSHAPRQSYGEHYRQRTTRSCVVERYTDAGAYTSASPTASFRRPFRPGSPSLQSRALQSRPPVAGPPRRAVAASPLFHPIPVVASHRRPPARANRRTTTPGEMGLLPWQRQAVVSYGTVLLWIALSGGVILLNKYILTVRLGPALCPAAAMRCRKGGTNRPRSSAPVSPSTAVQRSSWSCLAAAGRAPRVGQPGWACATPASPVLPLEGAGRNGVSAGGSNAVRRCGGERCVHPRRTPTPHE